MRRILGIFGVIAIVMLLGVALEGFKDEGVSLVGAEPYEVFGGVD